MIENKMSVYFTHTQLYTQGNVKRLDIYNVVRSVSFYFTQNAYSLEEH